MIAAMIDGNGQIVPICWALVPKESYSHWVWFLNHMRQSFNTEHFEIDQLEKLVIMSDSEKGLNKAVSEALPNAKHSHCCQHIAANVQSRFGIHHPVECVIILPYTIAMAAAVLTAAGELDKSPNIRLRSPLHEACAVHLKAASHGFGCRYG
jgi:hypothetical protein